MLNSNLIKNLRFSGFSIFLQNTNSHLAEHPYSTGHSLGNADMRACWGVVLGGGEWPALYPHYFTHGERTPAAQ
jgi:hypothetical protein